MSIAGKVPKNRIGFDVPPRIKDVIESFNCTFENGMCNLTQDKTDALDFLLHNGTGSTLEDTKIKHNQISGKITNTVF